jgi:hypothetical protein
LKWFAAPRRIHEDDPVRPASIAVEESTSLALLRRQQHRCDGRMNGTALNLPSIFERNIVHPFSIDV